MAGHDHHHEFHHLTTLWPKLARRLNAMEKLDEEAFYNLQTEHLDYLIIYPQMMVELSVF